VPLQVIGIPHTVQSNIVALPQGGPGTSNLFAVTGDVYVYQITGAVTVAIGAVANATKLTAVCGALTGVDLCATTDINGLAAGYIFSPITTLATAMGNNANGVLVNVGAAVGFIMGCGTTGAGIIRVSCAGADGGTGRVRWTCAYIPLSSGSQIVSS
jgi:hypothetical protein